MGLVYLPTFHLNLWKKGGKYFSPMEHVGIHPPKSSRKPLNEKYRLFGYLEDHPIYFVRITPIYKPWMTLWKGSHVAPGIGDLRSPWSLPIGFPWKKGICTYMKTIKINHSCRWTYHFSMGILWVNHFLSGPASFRSHSSSGLGLARAAPGTGDGVSGGEGGNKKWEKLNKKSGRMCFYPTKTCWWFKECFCLFIC